MQKTALRSKVIVASTPLAAPAAAVNATVATVALAINVSGKPKGLSLRHRFIDHLTLRQLARRTVQSYTEWIIHLARFHGRSPDQLGNPEISAWLLHLMNERKLSASSIITIRSRRADS